MRAIPHQGGWGCQCTLAWYTGLGLSCSWYTGLGLSCSSAAPTVAAPLLHALATGHPSASPHSHPPPHPHPLISITAHSSPPSPPPPHQHHGTLIPPLTPTPSSASPLTHPPPLIEIQPLWDVRCSAPAIPTCGCGSLIIIKRRSRKHPLPAGAAAVRCL